MTEWSSLPLSGCLEQVPRLSKIPKKQFLTRGRYPVVSQEQGLVNGYWDNEQDIVRVARPVVIYGDHTQIVKLIDFDFVVGADGVKVLIPKRFLDGAYLHYFLLANPVKKLGYSRHFRLVKQLQIRFPNMREQKRIVAILDEAFAGIEAAIANTEKNLANARELFESYVNAVFSQQDKGWYRKPLAEFVESFGSLLHKADYISQGVPLVNPINIVDGEVIPDERKMIGENTKQRLRAYVLKVGDIVIARRGEIGRCAVITESQKGWVCGTGCFFIRPSEIINSRFLAYLLRSTRYRIELERRSSGATMLNLSNKSLSNLPVSMPDIEQQNRIVDQISALFGQRQAIQSIYQQKLTALAELKQSLLQKAFSGEVTSEPEPLKEEEAA